MLQQLTQSVVIYTKAVVKNSTKRPMDNGHAETGIIIGTPNVKFKLSYLEK